MKKIIALLLTAILMLMASAAPVWADEDEKDEAAENEAGEESGDEKENSMPGFEFAFAVAGALAAARLLRA